MTYIDYIGNVTRFAVELANAGDADELSPESRRLLTEHAVEQPKAGELTRLVALVREALRQIVDATPPDAIRTLIADYPPDLHLSDHDNTGTWHIHYAHDGLAPGQWIGQVVAASLAHVATSDPGLTLGRCAARGCRNFFVDQSRNRTRRFCGNTCASRTTVAAYRARRHGPA